MATRELAVRITGDPKSLSRAFRQVDRDAGLMERGSRRVGSALGTMAKAGALAGVAIGGIFTKTGIQNALDEERAMARVENVIKTTGGAANISAQGVNDLSVALQKQTGTADDVIQAGAGLLLTFTKVRNEAGKGNDVFNQGVAAANDLSVAMGTDMNSAALLVGKALNDPIRGVTALRRSGVQLTEQQQEQVAAFVESGNVLGAQKIILAELQTQFGGAAAAQGETTEATQQLQRDFEDASQAVMQGVLPAVASFANFARTELVPRIAAVADAIRRNWPAIREVTVTVFNAVLAAVRRTIDWFETNILPTIRAIVAGAKRFWEMFGDDIKRAFDFIVRQVRRAMTILREVIELVLAVIRGDWGKAWGSLKKIVSTAFAGILDYLRTLPRILLGIGLSMGKGIARGIGDGVASIAGEIRDKIWGLIPGPLRRFLSGPNDGGTVIPGSAEETLTGGARGGRIPGVYTGRDDRVMAVAGGEAILTPRQQSMVPGGRRTLDAIFAATGGRIGGSAFSRGGVVGGAIEAARSRAVSNLGEPYGKPSRGESRTGPNSWDCSGFATYVANVNVGGTTASAYSASTGVRDHSRYPIVWGFRKSHSGGYRGGYDEHMGVRVGGVWYQTSGGQTAQTGSDSSWQEIRVPNGLQNLVGADGDGPGGETAPGNPQLSPFQQLVKTLAGGGLGASAANAARRVIGAGQVGGVSDAFSSSLSGPASRVVSAAGRSARTKARRAGKSPDEVAAAGEEAERKAEVKALKGQIRGIDTARRKLAKAKAKLLGDLKRIAKGAAAGKKAAARRVRVAIAQVTNEIRELLGIRAEVRERLAEINEQVAEDAYNENYDDGSGAEVDAGPGPDDFLDAAVARAALTPGLEDDLAAARAVENARLTEYLAAEASGDPRAIADRANAYAAAKAAREQIEATIANTEAVNANTEAVKQSFGGSVSFGYRGQQYVLGTLGMPSSDRLAGAEVGI